MRRPWPPARTMPLTWLMKTDFTSKLHAMNKNRFLVPFLNLGHFLDHLVMLVFPTVVIALARDWGRPYAELLPLALGGFIAFGAFALPAGWLAAFFVPGIASIAAGAAYLALVPDPGPLRKRSSSIGLNLDRRTMARIFVILLVATSCGGVIFNSTTIAMPKLFEERLQALTHSNLGIGALVAFVYTLAAFAQLAMGSLIDRFELRRLMIGIALAQIPLLALAANLQGWAMLAGALLMMLAVFGQIPLNDAIVGRYCADEYRGRVF